MARLQPVAKRVNATKRLSAAVDNASATTGLGRSRPSERLLGGLLMPFNSILRVV